MITFNFRNLKGSVATILFVVLVLGSVIVYASDLNTKQEIVIRDNIAEWFGGETLHKYVGNNRDYDWYIDQRDTGEHSNSNCGPSSAAMAMKWADAEFEGSAEAAREMYPAYGGWWRTNIFFRYFEALEQPYYTKMLESDKEVATTDMKTLIDEGKIFILCIDMNYITKEENPIRRTNRFYNYADGHFLVVKGYAVIDDLTYFEVYDPNSWGQKYDDGQLKGEDRYYRANELIDAAHNWYQFAIIVE